HRFGHFSRQEPIIAQEAAGRLTLIFDILQTCVRAIGAARRLRQIGIEPQRVVPVSVQTESVPPTAVYNLTLERDNAYYANGILVFNCCTFAEPVAVASLPSGKPRHQSEYDAYASLDKAVRGSYNDGAYGGR